MDLNERKVMLSLIDEAESMFNELTGLYNEQHLHPLEGRLASEWETIQDAKACVKISMMYREEEIKAMEDIASELPTAADRAMERINCLFEHKLDKVMLAIKVEMFDDILTIFRCEAEAISEVLEQMEEEMDRHDLG